MLSTARVTAILVCFLLVALPLAVAKDEPDKIVVQHILIGFNKSIRGKEIERTKRDAKLLAFEVYDRAVAGEDFDAMVKQYTNDAYPGKLLLTNKNAPRIPGGTMRSQVVPKFGDVSFRLDVGEFGLATYNAELSPYGWHIIKRLE